MRASQTRQETRARENIIQGMEAAHGLLSSKSCQILSKKTSFKKFLAFMAEKAPETMGKTLEDILKKMPQPTGNDLTGKGRKRAPDQAARNEARETKKAKLETVRMFGREAIPNEDGERGAQTVPSTAHSMRFWSLNRGTTPEPLFFGSEEENTKADENAMEEAQVQEEVDTKADESEAEEAALREEEDTKADEGAAEEAEMQEEEIFKANAAEETELHEEEDNEDAEAVEQKLHDKSRKLKDYTAYQIEEGLTRGIPAISQLVASEFAKIPRLSNGVYSMKDGSRILFACQKLQFETVIDALKTFFKAPARKYNPIPSSCDVNDPSHLLRILRKIDGFIQEPKVHKAFTQMKFFTTINARAEAQGCPNYLDLVKQLVGQEYGAVSQNYVDEKVKEYLSDYHKGCRWLETAQSFGGTAAVFIIIVAGIGAGKADRDWTDYERSCLELAISYLPSVKKIVECLGASALEDYCRHGHLPEEKVKELEELEGTMPDLDSEDEDQESDDDDDENGNE